MATPEQWEDVEQFLTTLPYPSTASCLLKLRDRLVAAEQRTSELISANEALRERLSVLEEGYDELAARLETIETGKRSQPTPNPSQIRSSAAGDLMQSVGAAICTIADCGDTPLNWAPEARAAVLAVAEWFDAIGYGATASILRQEVERHG
jgi:hypothetical protein